jgi:hypothetical protein
MPSVKQEKIGQPTTTSYASLLKAFITGFIHCTIVVTNSHGTNGLKFKILVSNHAHGAVNTWAEEKAEATLAAGAVDRYILTGSFNVIDVQVIDASEGDHATANAWLLATGI